jgi:hypothetical protein
MMKVLFGFLMLSMLFAVVSGLLTGATHFKTIWVFLGSSGQSEP